eukprot:5457022-Amphidinium_carterae.1
MQFLGEQKLGEIVDRNSVKSTVWTARWAHRVKGDGVRSRYVARQFKNATDEVESDVYAATRSDTTTDRLGASERARDPNRRF